MQTFWDTVLRGALFLGVTLMLALSSSPLMAQKTIVKGRVLDASTQQPLPFVNIAFKNSKIGTTSNLDGYFTLETYYPTDSLIASSVGFIKQTKRVKRDVIQTINFNLQPGVQLQEVVVRPDKKDINPALVILDKVLANKKINNKSKLDAYEYEVYNKVEFDLNNIDEKFKSRKVWKKFDFVFDYVDSTGDKPFLPIFMTESMSDYYYTRIPKRNKEIIKATMVSGVKNESIQQFLGDMYQNVNIYDNYVKIFNKSFLSPVANVGKASYRYYLIDSSFVENTWCYKIKFVPRREHELNFTGYMWIADTTYAVKEVEATISKSANINFVQDLSIHQVYNQVEKEVWMLTRDYMEVDFNLADRTIGIYGKKTSSYRNFTINKPRPGTFYSEGTNIVVKDDANQKTREYWESTRHEELSKTESQVYEMVDTLNQVPAFRTYVDVIKIITTGYKEFEKFELGPYTSIYSFNIIEGHRFKMGARTLKEFNEKIRLRGYLAYGTKDQQFKYAAGTDIFFSRKPWSMIHIDYNRDIEQLGTSVNFQDQDNLLASIFRANPANQLNAVESYKIRWEHFWSDGFSHNLKLQHRSLWSVSDLLKFEHKGDDGVVRDAGYVKFTEVELGMRLALREKFVLGSFDRYSLGSKYPVVGVQATFGLKGVLGSEYEYQKLFVYLTDKIYINPFGYTQLVVGAGKIWGLVPFPALELHNGNETFFYDPLAFNLMNYYEYASDEYIEAGLTHHFNGIFLNRIPYMRKLQWREVIHVKGVAGNLSAANQQEMIFPTTLTGLTKPYVEMGVGIENIFKILRVDGLWRLTNLSKGNDVKRVRNFGLAFSLQFAF
ncbi:carboxypeptidase-like regulatory domain-containing protein [bacterium SCSIO 12741]|nr:carboxypeptidase-like regulatory domain-containing protein [bacterium SCSIO 12741]